MNKPKQALPYKTGESIATKFLASNGYTIICQNYRLRCGEIDIIVEKDQHLIFVEVKSRTSPYLNAALASVSYSKQKRISRTAQLYINENPIFANHYFRFDVIVVNYCREQDTYSVTHLEDAFRFIAET